MLKCLKIKKMLRFVPVIIISFFLIACTSSKVIGNKISLHSTLKELSVGFKSPSVDYRPETWFHLNGNNISKEGLTLDLEAIKNAGLQGIHLINKAGGLYPDVKPIKILSSEWKDMIRHAADECKRLGLKFTIQNCPGWSINGGPWVSVEEAHRMGFIPSKTVEFD